MAKFKKWEIAASKELDRQEECLQRFEDLRPIQENQAELLNDIMTHQADIRFMSMAVQKYMEEAKVNGHSRSKFQTLTHTHTHSHLQKKTHTA